MKFYLLKAGCNAQVWNARNEVENSLWCNNILFTDKLVIEMMVKWLHCCNHTLCWLNFVCVFKNDRGLPFLDASYAVLLYLVRKIWTPETISKWNLTFNLFAVWMSYFIIIGRHDAILDQKNWSKTLFSVFRGESYFAMNELAWNIDLLIQIESYSIALLSAMNSSQMSPTDYHFNPW